MNWHDDLQTYCSKRITIKNKIIKNKESRRQMRIACQIQIEKIPKTKMRQKSKVFHKYPMLCIILKNALSKEDQEFRRCELKDRVIKPEKVFIFFRAEEAN